MKLSDFFLEEYGDFELYEYGVQIEFDCFSYSFIENLYIFFMEGVEVFSISGDTEFEVEGGDDDYYLYNEELEIYI